MGEAKEILLTATGITAATNLESRPGRAKRKAGKTYSPDDRKIQGSWVKNPHCPMRQEGKR